MDDTKFLISVVSTSSVVPESIAIVASCRRGANCDFYIL